MVNKRVGEQGLEFCGAAGGRGEPLLRVRARAELDIQPSPSAVSSEMRGNQIRESEWEVGGGSLKDNGARTTS